jgi:membrane protein YqaA with SNARE-associated domain
VRSLFGSLLGYFLTPAGLVALGILDSSLIFFLPLGIDVVLILLCARHPEWFWMYALAATAGSLIGAAGTYWLGKKVGEDGLRRWIGERKLARVRQRVGGTAATGVAALAIIPPPFPFTALVLAGGACGLDRWRFFSTLAVVRLLRFGVEGALAASYGRQILVWMESTAFEVTVGILIVLALVGTVVSAASVLMPKRAAATKPAS